MPEPTKIGAFIGPYTFLSNFYTCYVEYEGMRYPSVEHAYQAAKTFDRSLRLKIAGTPRAGAAKRLGNTLRIRPDWEEVKVPIMMALLRTKFAIPGLRTLLLSTGAAELIEGNHWHDNFWGVCACERCGGRGQNTLGILLMQVRHECTQTP